MRFDVVTIFPAMVEQALAAGIVGRAIERGTLEVKIHDLRDFTTDRHRVVDDVPYGGGPGYGGQGRRTVTEYRYESETTRPYPGPYGDPFRPY